MIEYYNGIDEKVDEWPKGMPREFQDHEKYYLKDGGSPVQNSTYDTEAQLERLKNEKRVAIAMKTHELLSNETFDYNGSTFRRGSIDLVLWLGLRVQHLAGSLAFPVQIQDSEGNMVILNQSDFEAAFDAGFNSINDTIAADTALKNAVHDAPDLAALKAVKDERA
jgi:hypothetical protein